MIRVLPSAQHKVTACGPFYLSEAWTHPEEPPLLRLLQLSDAGEILGDVWLRPADISTLIVALQLQLQYSYGPRAEKRRWFGASDGPVLNMGIGPQPSIQEPP